MNTQITFEKQDLPFEAEPNTADPTAKVLDGDVLLTFPLMDLEKEGKIIFKECVIYRVGGPNDEGFYGYGSDPRIENDSLYSKKSFPDLEFGYFYKVSGLDWKKGLLGEGVVVIDGEFMNKADLSHFVFFMKDGTFECVAKSYEVLEC